MKYTEHTTKSGKLIRVWDDLLSHSTILSVYLDLRSWEYPLVFQNDAALQDYSAKFGFGKGIDKNFMLSVLNTIQGAESFPIKSYLKRCEPTRSWVNIYNGSIDSNRYHTDEDNSEYVSLLYYANPKWDLEWDGGTIFRSENLEDVEYLSDYKPGRFILFDSSIPHKIYQTSSSAHPYRFTVNTIFKNYNLRR